MRLNDEQLKQLKDRLLGKRIKVPFVSNSGYGTKREADYIIGICNFIGYNPYFPNRGLQVTVDRLPVNDVDYRKIELLG